MKERFVTMTAKCDFCGKETELKLTVESVEEFFSPNRRHVQDIFPYLTAGERELLISHMCEECWDRMFSFDEDEDEEDYLDNEEYLRATEISCEELKDYRY